MTDSSKRLLSKKEQIKAHAEASLEFFIKLVHPQRVLGECHKELITWWTREEAKSHQLTLLPRDHQKSALIAYRVAWEITKNPAIRVLYISSTANLATKQLKFIKDILTADSYRAYWPEMVNKDESKREKWTESEISVDHPIRKKEIVRDPTIFTAGLTTGIVGMHCDIAVLDDVVVDENAYTEEGRRKVRAQASYLASIAGTEGRQWVVGTRYHPKDLYDSMQGTVYEIFGADGDIVDSQYLYEVYERQVESMGDGTGEFLWPRMQRYDGKWFGFNQEILAKKRAQYADRVKFRSQYYNNPNDESSSTISRELFQYYDKSNIRVTNGHWYYRNNRLNVVAAVDFAFSLNKKADYTCIVVVGVDADHTYYILDIDRFKTDKISDYFEHILKLHTKWGFKKIRAETTVAQQVIVKDLKDNYIRPFGLHLGVEDFRPTSMKQGTKEERIEAVLQPKYNNRQIMHYKGGNAELLEEELVLVKPPHDDIKDALAAAIDFAQPPTNNKFTQRIFGSGPQNTHASEALREKYTNSRFGGIN